MRWFERDDPSFKKTDELTNLGLFCHGEVLDLPVPVVKDQPVVVPLLPENTLFDYGGIDPVRLTNKQFKPNVLQMLVQFFNRRRYSR